MRPSRYNRPLNTADFRRVDAKVVEAAVNAFPHLPIDRSICAFAETDAYATVLSQFNEDLVRLHAKLQFGRRLILDEGLVVPHGTESQLLHIICLIAWQYLQFDETCDDEEFKWLMSAEHEKDSVRNQLWWWFEVYGGFELNALVPVNSIASTAVQLRTENEFDTEFRRGEIAIWEEDLSRFEAERGLLSIPQGPYSLEARAARRQVIKRSWMNMPKLFTLSDAFEVLGYCRFIREQGGLRSRPQS